MNSSGDKSTLPGESVKAGGESMVLVTIETFPFGSIGYNWGGEGKGNGGGDP